MDIWSRQNSRIPTSLAGLIEEVKKQIANYSNRMKSGYSLHKLIQIETTILFFGT